MVVYCRWKAWLNGDIDESTWEDSRPRYMYPFTDKYVRFDVGERGRKQRAPNYPGVNLNNDLGEEVSVYSGHSGHGAMALSHEHITPHI